MKLSDYVADFLARQGIRHVFVVSGGASLHLIHAVADHPDLQYICPHHEQAGAMAADAYARVTGGLGAAIATSGPGATNMITGICCAYYDSVPVLYLTGQVATFRDKGDTGVRQLGFQETDIVSMCATITKYAVTLKDPQRIRYELEAATHAARSGRPGPVLIDIPDNLQRAEIDPSQLVGFTPEGQADPAQTDPAQAPLDDLVDRCLALVAGSQRPVVVLGWGVHLAHAEAEARALVEALGVPVCPTWGGLDLLPHGHRLLIGSFGTHGSRFGNFAVQNADLVISIGSRLDTHGIGSPFSSFARGARKVMVDIDPTEIHKFARYDLTIDLPIAADAKLFCLAALRRMNSAAKPDVAAWLDRIKDWQTRYPILRAECRDRVQLDPYVFVQSLSDAAESGDIVVVDTGCSVAWMSQGFAFKPGQRYFHAFNNTPMGYGLPGAIGASLALDGQRVICVVGDGSLMMNLQELATAAYHHLPIKIFVMNNHGYSMIQQTQDQWLGSHYAASSESGGLGFPDFSAMAKSFGYRTVTFTTNAEIETQLPEILAWPGPVFCTVELRPEERVIPQVKFGRAIEDSEPLLPRPEFLENMLVAPLPASLDAN